MSDLAETEKEPGLVGTAEYRRKLKDLILNDMRRPNAAPSDPLTQIINEMFDDGVIKIPVTPPATPSRWYRLDEKGRNELYDAVMGQLKSYPDVDRANVVRVIDEKLAAFAEFYDKRSIPQFPRPNSVVERAAAPVSAETGEGRPAATVSAPAAQAPAVAA